MITEVLRYETEDAKVFDTREKATAWEATLQRNKEFGIFTQDPRVDLPNAACRTYELEDWLCRWGSAVAVIARGGTAEEALK